MGLVARAFGGCLALACTASMSGGAAVPVVERALTPAPYGSELTSLAGPADVPPEQQSPSADVRVSVTQVEPDVDVEIVDSTGSVIGGSLGSTSQAGAVGSTGIPAMVLAAYQAAAERLGSEDPSCGLRWEVLAGIGKIESSHARGGQLNTAGVSVPPIIGPVLNGGPGVAAISDSDDGAWDGDSVWDRAVGPMQFIPGTWRGFGADSDGDGTADPHNVWDATLSAGLYLCAGDGNLLTAGGLQAALFRYNHSLAYVDHVMSWINAYLDGGPIATPDRGPGKEAEPDGEPAREPEEPEVPEPEDDGEDDPKDPKSGGEDPPAPPGADQVVVPEVVGMARAEAEAELTDLGLVVEVVEQDVADEALVGQVLGQAPGALAEVEPGAEVTVTVGVAPEAVAVPDLVGMVLADAKAELEALGLAVTVVEEVVADEAEVGRVLLQSPEAATELAPGAGVTVTVGVVPPPDLVEVPNLVGLTLAEVEAELADSEFVVEVVEQVVEDEAQVGLVLEQTPEASTEVEPDAVVTLTVGVAPPPPEPVVVPEVVGMARADAVAALTDLGLDVVVVEQVEPGAEVTLTVGAAPLPDATT